MAYVAQENSGTNAILGVLLVVVALILGFIIFRNGLGAVPSTGNSINVDVPSIPQNDGVGGVTTPDSGNQTPQQQ